MQLKKIFKWLFLAILLLIIGIIALGALSSATYEKSITKEYYFTPGVIFKALTEPQYIKMRKPEITDIEILEKNEYGMSKWIENEKYGQNSIVEIQEIVPGVLVEIEKKEGAMGLSGKWRYEIEVIKDKCLVTISEKSECSNIFTRAVLVLGGRDSNILREHHNLLHTLQQNFDQF